jgi:UDP-2,3-diacylglucosamine pyrophosphatase LpxH
MGSKDQRVKREVRALWVSDIHLGTKDCQADALLAFLQQYRFHYLYLVGDLIDLWQLKRHWYWPQAFNTLLQKILKSSRKGTEVYFIPGNHDGGFRALAGLDFGGVHIRKRAIHVTADGRRLLVTHGDEFDAAVRGHPLLAYAGNFAYDYLITLNRLLNAGRKAMGLPYLSFSGLIKRKVKNAVKFITRFEETVTKYARDQGLDGVVCGHIHQACLRESQGFLYANTGDWLESFSGLIEHLDGRMELVNGDPMGGWREAEVGALQVSRTDPEEAWALAGTGHVHA